MTDVKELSIGQMAGASTTVVGWVCVDNRVSFQGSVVVRSWQWMRRKDLTYLADLPHCGSPLAFPSRS